jgi:carboxyl-terminal processing protease
VARQQQSSLEGSFEGIGAYVDQQDGVFVIITPIHGSPAEAAGILAGDVVLAVDGTDITGMDQWEVIQLIRGPSGTPVVLTVIHPDESEPEEIRVVRGRIDIESVLWARIPGTQLAQVQITQFANDTSRELRTVLRAINATRRSTSPDDDIEGIVLDLRNNPGGYLQEALRVGSQFLDSGEIILHEKDAKDNIVTYRAEGEGLARTIPVVVLINQGSASAAEILAGAMQENGRAVLIGMPTVGTGTVLRPFTLSNGSVLRLGVTNWLTPGYNLIKGQGIQPDEVIEQEASVEMINSFLLDDLSAEELGEHEDLQFKAAVEMLQAEDTARQVTQP